MCIARWVGVSRVSLNLTTLECFKDPQDRLDSNSELPCCNSEFQAHQENSKECLPLWFRAPLFTRIVSWSVLRCSGFLVAIVIVCLLIKATFSNESLRWKFFISTIPNSQQKLEKCSSSILIGSQYYRWSTFTFHQGVVLYCLPEFSFYKAFSHIELQLMLFRHQSTQLHSSLYGTHQSPLHQDKYWKLPFGFLYLENSYNFIRNLTFWRR